LLGCGQSQRRRGEAMFNPKFKAHLLGYDRWSENRRSVRGRLYFASVNIEGLAECHSNIRNYFYGWRILSQFDVANLFSLNRRLFSKLLLG